VTDPKLARDTPNGRFYEDPRDGRQLISVTNALGVAVAKQNALIPWAAGLVADHVIGRPIEVARRARTDRTALRKELVGIPRATSEKAMNLGSRVHHRAHAMVLEEPFPEDPEVDPYARQLQRFWRTWGVDIDRDIVSAEISVFHRRYGYAGTADVFMWLPTGRYGRRQLWLLDYKSSAKRPASAVYSDQAFQLAALRFAEGVWLPDDTDGEIPKVTRTGILNLRPKSHALIELPGDRNAFRGFLGALRVAGWLYEAPRSFPTLLPPVAVQAAIKTDSRRAA
jgi:hypothetical protein